MTEMDKGFKILTGFQLFSLAVYCFMAILLFTLGIKLALHYGGIRLAIIAFSIISLILWILADAHYRLFKTDLILTISWPFRMITRISVYIYVAIVCVGIIYLILFN